jgi:PiT family inorganic phosphate transporter
MDNLQISFGVIVHPGYRRFAVRFHERLSRCSQLDCHHRFNRVLKPHQAVIWASAFNFLAYFLFHLTVAKTIGKGTVDPSIVDHYIIFGALIGAIIWNIVTWYYGIPSSSSHALIGGLVGAAHRQGWFSGLIMSGVLKIIAFIFIAPLLGFVIGGTLMVIVSWICRNMAPRKVDKYFRRLQLLSAAAYSLGHGGNDAQKTVGIIWMLLDCRRYIAGHRCGTAGWVVLILLFGDGFWHHVWWLAHRQDHGQPNHQAESGARLSVPTAAVQSPCSWLPHSVFRCRQRTPLPAPSPVSVLRAVHAECAGVSLVELSGLGY